MARLARLSLVDFRGYECAELRPGAGLNLVVGANGEGKTSLLEAVWLVSTGRLMRGARDVQAIRDGCDRAYIQAEVGDQGTEIAVELVAGQRRRVSLNGLALTRASDVLGRFPSASFSTADMRLVTGEPADRRRAMDSELAQLSPAYLRHLSVYKRALEQRNALLKAAQAGYVAPEGFEVWEEAMAHHGVALRAARVDWVESILAPAQSVYRFLTSAESFEVRYVSSDESSCEGGLLTALGQARESDVRRGATSVGPHRDDLWIAVRGREARVFASQGQQRSAVLALLAASVGAIRDALGEDPVVLLDDVFSDLDEGRRRRLTELVSGFSGQVFLTATEPSLAGRDLLSGANVFRVQSFAVRDE